jgi:hypothetical protein
MELAIVAGVALAGWYLNTPAPKPPTRGSYQPLYAGKGTPVDATTDDGTRALLDYNENAVKRFTQSKFPERSGIIAPFFRDVRSQQTSTAVKQRTMENFIGNDPTWKPKREQEALFNPTPQDIDSSGRAGNTPAYDADTYRQSLTNIQSGTFPFERVNVGRGLGISPNDKAADNFHPMLRIIPPSGDLHKHHEMPGRVTTTGASVTQERALVPHIRHNRPPRVWTQERYPLAKGRSTATGPAHRGEHMSVVPPCHLDTEHRIGVAYREGGMPVNGTLTRQDDRTTSIDTANLTGPRGVIPVNETLTRQDDRTTSIDTANLSGPNAAGAYVAAHFDPAKFESLDREAQGQIMGVKYYNPSITKYNQDAPHDTIRDVTGARFTGPGHVEPVVKGQTNYCTGLQLLKEAKRGSYVNNTHVPGAQRTDAYRQANLGLSKSPYMEQQYKMRCQLQQRPSQTHINSSASRYASTTSQVGTFASNGKKNPGEANPRNDFQLAQRVLKDNPYVVKQPVA